MAAGKKNMTTEDPPGPPAGSSQPGGDSAEVAEERVEVVTFAAAIDVAKGSGMVCTRVPGSRSDRKRQAVWQVVHAPDPRVVGRGEHPEGPLDSLGDHCAGICP
jgi:hypothetical protein